MCFSCLLRLWVLIGFCFHGWVCVLNVYLLVGVIMGSLDILLIPLWDCGLM